MQVRAKWQQCSCDKVYCPFFNYFICFYVISCLHVLVSWALLFCYKEKLGVFLRLQDIGVIHLQKHRGSWLETFDSGPMDFRSVTPPATHTHTSLAPTPAPSSPVCVPVVMRSGWPAVSTR